MKLATFLQEKKIIPILDVSYQGFASGDFDADASVIRDVFMNNPLWNYDLFVCQSLSKTLTLYTDRAGVLFALCRNKESALWMKD